MAVVVNPPILRVKTNVVPSHPGQDRAQVQWSSLVPVTSRLLTPRPYTRHGQIAANTGHMSQVLGRNANWGLTGDWLKHALHD